MASQDVKLDSESTSTGAISKEAQIALWRQCAAARRRYASYARPWRADVVKGLRKKAEELAAFEIDLSTIDLGAEGGSPFAALPAIWGPCRPAKHYNKLLLDVIEGEWAPKFMSVGDAKVAVVLLHHAVCALGKGAEASASGQGLRSQERIPPETAEKLQTVAAFLQAYRIAVKEETEFADLATYEDDDIVEAFSRPIERREPGAD